MPEPNIAQVEREISLFADKGRHVWRRATGINLAFLASLPAVQEHLAGHEAGAQVDPDAERNAVIEAVNQAIKRLPQPFRDAALEHLGFTDCNPRTPMKKGPREAAAAKKLARTQRWYELPNKEFNGLTPRDYIVALVTCALCGISDPVALIAARAHGPDRKTAPDGDSPTPITRRFTTRYRWLALAASVAVGGAISAIVLGGHAQHSVITVGAPTKPIRRGPRPSPDDEAAAIELDACTTVSGCRSGLAKQPVVTRSKETVSFKLDIGESYSEPIKTMKLVASATSHENFVEVAVVAEWTIPLSPGAVASRTATVNVRVAFDHSGLSVLPRLEYVPNSTQLYKLIAFNPPEEVSTLGLPDGLFLSSGLTLKQVGPQRSCLACRYIHAGSIHFAMRPVATVL